MASTSIGLNGSLQIGGVTVKNQITTEGAVTILQALQSVSPIRITNLMFLTGFSLNAVGKTEKELTFSDVFPYIAPQAFLGANNIQNENLGVDMKIVATYTPTIELNTIGTIPASRANNLEFNAAILVMGGNPDQSTSTGVDNYSPTNTEKLFAIALFDAVSKDNVNPFVVIWYTRIE